MSENKKLKVLFYCLDAYGHINPCVGVAEQLKKRGHEIIFIVKPTFKGKLMKYGFKEEVLHVQEKEEEEIKKSESNENGNENESNHAKHLTEIGMFDDISNLEKLKIIVKMEPYVLKERYLDKQIKEIIEKNKPDINITVFLACAPILSAGCPWVNLMPANPLLAFFHGATPPSSSGKYLQYNLLLNYFNFYY